MRRFLLGFCAVLMPLSVSAREAATPAVPEQVAAKRIAPDRLTQGSVREQVDLELILMADGSGSIDDDEFVLQRMGYVRALRHPSIIAAIRSGRLGRIALSYVEWSGPELHVPIVPWTTIRTREDIEAFAARLEAHPRELYGGGTALGNAILYGMQSLDTNAYDAPRQVIDISGDGPDRNGLNATVGRDRAVAAGMTINGLPILDGWPGLDRFFYDNVIGGPGAFVESARGFKDVYYAIRRKMIREIADAPVGEGSKVRVTER